MQAQTSNGAGHSGNSQWSRGLGCYSVCGMQRGYKLLIQGLLEIFIRGKDVAKEKELQEKKAKQFPLE